MSTGVVSYLPTAIPSEKQLDFQEWELGLFLHFGIRTFYEGHQDWDGKTMDPANFNPAALDCEQWVRTAQAAGMRYLVFTAKHHDGFANWPSQYTDYSVAASRWKGGKGDVVREFTDACHRYGMKVGLYYSPAEWHCPAYTDPKAYDDYFINQVSEILSQYGEVNMLWLDGCGSDGHDYDWPRITRVIRKLQPNILISQIGDQDYRWGGCESGIAPIPCWNTITAIPTQLDPTQAQSVTEEPVWRPAECDCMLRYCNWFYSDQDEDTVKSVDELVGMYYYTVGRGCNMLLNVGPNRDGLIPDTDAKRLKEFGAEMQRRFARPLATLAQCQLLTDRWECTPAPNTLIDHVVLQETLGQGEHVRRFAIEVIPALTYDAFPPITIYQGYNIGHKAICQFPPVAVRKVILRILESDGPVDLRTFNLYFTGGSKK